MTTAVYGLSNDLVLSMALDGEGCVWVGTEAGLNRIAGKTISAWTRSQMGVAKDKIASLYYDSTGRRILIGTEVGLAVYRLDDNVFGQCLTGDSLVHYSLVSMADDHHRGVWLAYANGRIQHLDCQENGQ